MQQQIIEVDNFVENINYIQQQESDQKQMEQQNIEIANALKQIIQQQIHQDQSKGLQDQKYKNQYAKISQQMSMNPEAISNSKDEVIKNNQTLQNVIKRRSKKRKNQIDLGVSTTTTNNNNDNDNNNNINNRKKIRLYIQDFEPYFPSFLQQINRYHLQNIPRIGPQYQITQLEQSPRFQSYYRPINHLRVHKGSDKDFSEQAYKKFKQHFGQNKTEEELILLRYQLQINDWNQLINQLVTQKQKGKRQKKVDKNYKIMGNNPQIVNNNKRNKL